MSKACIIALAVALFRYPSSVAGFGVNARIFWSHGANTYRLNALTLSMKKGTKRKAATASDSSTSIETKSILTEWAAHQDESFHDFSPAEAEEIRHALLTWYRANRRKLPWRGDPPPFDGSTAGIASKSGKKIGKDKDNAKSQPSIRNFFAPKNSSSSQDLNEPDKEESFIEGDALEVTGYGVWVSEIMLQQTRVEAVIPYYIKWMKRFPTVHDLAAASEEEVNAHWAGLGFYRRARLLHKGAKRVVEEYDGHLPTTVTELLKIDGIGRYTASAVASIAFDVCVPVVDGNVCRVLSRLRGIANHIKANVLKDDIGWKLAKQIVAAGDGKHAGEVNQAIMELGATFCSPSGSGTDDRDPLKGFYMSTKLGLAFAEELKHSKSSKRKTISIDKFMSQENGTTKRGCACRVCDPDGVASVLDDMSVAVDNAEDPADFAKVGHAVFPLSPPKKAKREEVLAVAAMSYTSPSTKDERWLLVKRPKDGLLAGQWEFPSVCVWTSATENKTKNGTHLKRKSENQTIPNVAARKRAMALNAFLDELVKDSKGEPVHGWVRQCPRENIGSSPLEHIFSHVRHTMWIEYGTIPDAESWDDADEWNATNGKELRWMSEKDMKSVGVTSGVKKILKLVKAKRK